MTETVGAENSYGELGRDVGVIGRWFRLAVGGTLSGYVIYPMVQSSSANEVLELALYFVATLSAYMAAQYFLGERLLAKVSAWLRTVILLGPLAVIFAFQLGPHVFHQALILYFGLSLIVSFFIRYGGCEVMSIPSLIFGTRYTVYCPLNVVDVMEKASKDRKM